MDIELLQMIPFLILFLAILIANGCFLGMYLSERRFQRGEYNSYERAVIEKARDEGFEQAKEIYLNAARRVFSPQGFPLNAELHRKISELNPCGSLSPDGQDSPDDTRKPTAA